MPGLEIFKRRTPDPKEVTRQIAEFRSDPRYQEMMSNPDYEIGLRDLLAELNVLKILKVDKESRVVRRALRVFPQLSSDDQRWVRIHRPF